jgi:uncharacterized membrane protein YfcA
MAFFDQYSAAWLIGLALALLATGLVAGTLAGLLGVGGGIVIVPVLYHLFTLLGIDESVRMHVAVGTSLATIIPTSIMSSRAHRKKGSLDMALIKRLMPSVVVGVIAGSIASRYLSGAVLTAVFATVALVVALNMAFKKDGFAVGNGLPGTAGTALLGGGIGGISTLMGIGGGTLSVPILNALRVPMHTAVGTGAMLGMVISFPGALAFLYNGLGVPLRPPLSIGYVNLLGMALIVPATMMTTGFGAKLAHSIDARRLRQVFAAFLALTSLRMLSSFI